MTVSVLPLSLMHLASTIIAAATHAETGADDGREDEDQDSDRGAYEEPHLVVDPLRAGRSQPVSPHAPFVSFVAFL